MKDPFLPKERHEDSVLYVYIPKQKVDIETSFNPFAISSVRRYIPRYWSPRIIAQMGVFTVHHNPTVAWSPSEVTEIPIAYNVRKKIKVALNKLGTHEFALFPDMDGIARYIDWLRTDVF